MRVRVLAAAVCIALLAGAIVLRVAMRWDEQPTPMPPVSRIETPASGAPDVETPSEADPALDAGILRGLVLTSRRLPVAAARVRVVSAELEPKTDPPDEIATSTDVEGRFQLKGLPTGQFRIEASAEGEFSRSIELGMPSPDPVELVLPGKAFIRGMALLDTGEVLTGVPVKANVADRICEARTGADGAYQLEVPEGPLAWIEASPPHRRSMVRPPGTDSYESGGYFFVSAREGFGWVDSAGREINFVFPDGASIDGVVLEPDGVPASDAEVKLMPLTGTPCDPWALKTDTQGRFLLEGLAPGAYVFAAESRRGILESSTFASSEEELAALDLSKVILAVPDSTQHVQIRLKAFAEVMGVVLDAADRPVAGAEVHVSTNLRWHRVVASGESGEFRTPVPPGSRLDLGVLAPNLIGGGYYTPKALDALEPLATSEVHVLRFSAPIPVRILVTDEVEVPLENATVKGIQGPWGTFSGEGGPTCGDLPERRTDSRGWLESRAWPEVLYLLEISAAGFSTARVKLEISGAAIERHVRLLHSHPGILRGTITSSDGAPIAFASVTAWPLESPDSISSSDFDQPSLARRRGASTDGRGKFSFAGLEGAYLLRAAADGFIEAETLLKSIDTSHDPLTIVLKPGLEIEGDVVFDSGEPAAFVSIDASSGGKTNHGLSGEDGVFKLRGVAPDCKMLRASGRGIYDVAIQLPQPPGTRLRIVVKARPSFRGLVLDPEGEPVRHARIPARLVGQGSTNQSFTLATNHEGRFQLFWEEPEPPAPQARLEVNHPERSGAAGWQPIQIEDFDFLPAGNRFQFQRAGTK